MLGVTYHSAQLNVGKLVKSGITAGGWGLL
jgi:hypothetical protein